MRAAYDALDDRHQGRDQSRSVCLHSLIYSREAIGFTQLSEDEIAAFRPVRQRLVRSHPVTGRKSLFLAAHAGAIEGWTNPPKRACSCATSDRARDAARNSSTRTTGACT